MNQTQMKRFTDEQISDAYAKSTSISDLLRQLGLSASGHGNRGPLRIRLDAIGLSYSNKRNPGGKGLPDRGNGFKCTLKDEEIFIENAKVSRSVVKSRIVKQKLLNREQCSICSISSEWNGLKLVMVLDHINGISNDHRLSNLRFVCPNCNSQLDTFSGRNLRVNDENGRQERFKIVRAKVRAGSNPASPTKLCNICKVNFHGSMASKCRKCHISKLMHSNVGKFKISWPTVDEMLEKLKGSNFYRLGRELGVSDNAIRKFLKRNNVSVN